MVLLTVSVTIST